MDPPKPAPAPVAGRGTDSAATDGAPSGDSPSAEPSGKTPPAERRRILLITNGAGAYWDACQYGVKDAEKELRLKDAGFSADLIVNDGTAQGQLEKLRQYGGQSDVAAIGVSVIDAGNAAIVDEMRKLMKRGIQVITVDSDVDRDKFRDARTAFLGTDNLIAGRELGVCAKHLRPDGGQYVTFVGRTGAQNAIERISGFQEGAGEKFESKDSMADDGDRTRARDNVRNAIANHPGLNTLVGIWSYNAPAIVDVVKDLKVRPRFTIVVFDAEPGAIKAMSEGMIDALIVQNPYQMGYQTVKMLKALVENDEATLGEMLPNRGEKDGDLFDTGLKIVVPDKGSPLKPDLFGRSTDFLQLGDFQQWLEHYGLEGS